ncbi:uncharacterized protein PAC_05649, partial [Phialocephala subalpina]
TTCIVFLLVIFTAIFLPSYHHLLEHYRKLEKTCRDSTEEGRGNVNNEKVFIAATLYDAEGLLVGGEWGIAIRQLVHLLDLDNQALEEFRKQISFRNRALLPLELNPSIKFDKLLFVNDVIFNPIDAAQLLFSTNINESGHAQYGAACAVDFINPFKFHDRFATRELEGYAMGVPFFPWFTAVGQGSSRKDILDQKDAIRDRACWGGMTAFGATWFQTLHPHFSENYLPSV